MRLDVNALRYLSKEEFRVLTAVEMGQKNHELVPLPLIDSISGLKHGGAFKCIKTLLRHKLVHHDASKYDGYRLTYLGYDFLAIRTLVNRGHVASVGRQIGVGKESDIYEVANSEGEVFALKMHRLGRTSFRAVKRQRDYLGKRQSYSWLYLSRLAAIKEFAFMKALGDHGLPVPRAIDNNRHAVLMTLVDAVPLVQVRDLDNPGKTYQQCMDLISQLAGKGLVHCDFNEFNLMINEEDELTLIDFPQMVSVSHANAKELFDRDVECIVRFFTKKIGYMPQLDEQLPAVRPLFEEVAAQADDALDVQLSASGFQKQHQKVLEQYQEAAQQEEEGEEGAGGAEVADSEDDKGASASDGEGELTGGSPEAQPGSHHLASETERATGDAPTAGRRPRRCRVDGPDAFQSVGLTADAAEEAGDGALSDGEGVQAAETALGEDSAATLARGGQGAASGSGNSACSGDEDEAGSSADGDDGLRQEQGGAPSHVPADRVVKERLVQQRLVRQHKAAAKRDATTKATRNVTKAKGHKARKAGASDGGW